MHASEKDAAEQPGERGVTMMATGGTDTRGARVIRKSLGHYEGAEGHRVARMAQSSQGGPSDHEDAGQRGALWVEGQ